MTSNTRTKNRLYQITKYQRTKNPYIENLLLISVPLKRARSSRYALWNLRIFYPKSIRKSPIYDDG